MERKLISEADSRPLVVIDPRAPDVARGARRRRARRRLARRPLREADRLLAADAWRPPRHGDRARPARLAGAARPARGVGRPRRPVAGGRPEPPRPVVYVAARPVDRAPRGLGRTPGGCLVVVPGAVATAARCSRSRAATATSRAASPAPPLWLRWKAPHDRRGAACGAGALAECHRERDEAAPPRARAPADARSARPQRPRPRGEPVLPSPSRASIAFTALAAWGALHWMPMLEPAEPKRGWTSSSSGCSRPARCSAPAG